MKTLGVLQVLSMSQPSSNTSPTASQNQTAPFINIVSNTSVAQVKRLPMTTDGIGLDGGNVKISGIFLDQLGLDLSQSVDIQVSISVFIF